MNGVESLTWADISVSVTIAILWILGDFVGAFMGLIPDFLMSVQRKVLKQVTSACHLFWEQKL